MPPVRTVEGEREVLAQWARANREREEVRREQERVARRCITAVVSLALCAVSAEVRHRVWEEESRAAFEQFERDMRRGPGAAPIG